jgi:hypothetical protein
MTSLETAVTNPLVLEITSLKSALTHYQARYPFRFSKIFLMDYDRMQRIPPTFICNDKLSSCPL